MARHMPSGVFRSLSTSFCLESHNFAIFVLGVRRVAILLPEDAFVGVYNISFS